MPLADPELRRAISWTTPGAVTIVGLLFAYSDHLKGSGYTTRTLGGGLLAILDWWGRRSERQPIGFTWRRHPE